MAELDSATQRLRAAVESLALPAADALARAGLRRPDALAVEFDEAYTVFIASLGALPGEEQLTALQRLDAQLQVMADPALQSKWTAEAMNSDADWDVLRRRASAVIAAFGW